jgi:hypothetical protein
MNVQQCIKLLPEDLRHLAPFVVRYVATQRDPLLESEPEASDRLDALVDLLVRDQKQLRMLRDFIRQHQREYPAEVQAIKDFIKRILPSPA